MELLRNGLDTILQHTNSLSLMQVHKQLLTQGEFSKKKMLNINPQSQQHTRTQVYNTHEESSLVKVENCINPQSEL